MGGYSPGTYVLTLIVRLPGTTTLELTVRVSQTALCVTLASKVRAFCAGLWGLMVMVLPSSDIVTFELTLVERARRPVGDHYQVHGAVELL